MFLKKIQACGFKSFADKVNIPFDQGITGIVGPNGSGKSNVIDAVRWVMGEQNAKNLRGKVATDIIFSGSANRKSLGMAEVTLTFDNTDESAFCPAEYRHEPEISLTRRLYIDGQREYLINRKPCRLKDIVSFFSTTGLGGKSYSMIQQGQVDRILNAKPEEIRVVLEEAAGTVVYKKRRDEAVKKLGQTQENLSRIEDLVGELERQQETLQTQMEKAKSWKEFTENLRSLELSLFAHNFHFYNDQLVAFQKEIDDEIKKEVELSAKMAQLEAEQLELQAALDAADPNIEGLRESVSIVREQIARAESIISGTDGKVSAKKERLGELEVEIKEDSDSLNIVEKQFQAAQEELSAAKQKAEELAEQIDSFQDQLDAVDEEAMVYTSRIEDYEDELKNIARLLETNTLRCEAINRERGQIDSDINEWQERIGNLSTELTEHKSNLAAVESQAAELQGGLDIELNTRNELLSAIKERKNNIAEFSTQKDQLKESYFDTRARYTSAQEVLSSASDVSAALHTLKEEEPEANCLKNGLLTDYISFSEEANELPAHARSAIESWAERLLADNLDDLNGLIRLSHKFDLGGFPVSVLSNWENPDPVALNEWVEKTDAEPLKNYLKVTKDHSYLDKIFSRLYLAPGIRLSQHELNDLPKGLIVFTSQGLQFKSDDEFTVGLSPNSKGILSRKTELEHLGSELKSCEGELAAAQSKLDQLQLEQSNDEMQLKELEEKLQGQNQEVLEISTALSSSRQLVEHKTELYKNATDQVNKLESQDRKLIDELSEQGQARLSHDEEMQRIKGELEEIKEESQGTQERKAEVFRLHDSRKLELVKSETRAQALQEGFERTSSQLERIQTTLSRRYEEKSRINLEIEEIQTAYQTSMSEMEDLLQRRETLEAELTEKREENSGILDSLRASDLELKKVRGEFSTVEKFISKRRVEMERLKVALEGIEEQSEEKYHLKIAEYEFEKDPEFNSQSVSKRVQRLRNKIEGLGAINMMAIEEYDELMERLEFITAQREEVFNSINLLEDALEEIEETSKNKFIETYETINKEFSGLFPILFPGGEAHLNLTTPEDPLNAGVEIIARLPGKKPQRMTLLSGGEKALTAISLIFALLKTKPTPFCFLDEVDAPLDEANVGRYNRVLEILAERFQFVVITHNRRTMEVLDTLYGVTMQEPGVSKIVGVDMKKDIPKHLQKAFREGDEARAGASAAAH